MTNGCGKHTSPGRVKRPAGAARNDKAASKAGAQKESERLTDQVRKK